MKCPVKLSPAVSEFIKKNDLVYIGVGSPSDVLVKGGKIVCESLRVRPDGLAGNGCNMTDHFGGLEDNHYFIRRPDAKKHFPRCLPKRKPRPKAFYCRAKNDAGGWTIKGIGNVQSTYDKDGTFAMHTGPDGAKYNAMAQSDIEGGDYVALTRAEFLARIKACGLNEDGAKIIPPAPKLRYFVPVNDKWWGYGTHDGGEGSGQTYNLKGEKACVLGPIKDVMRLVKSGDWAEVTKAEALARVKPAKTEVETLREENAVLKARVAALESEQEKLRSALEVLSNF